MPSVAMSHLAGSSRDDFPEAHFPSDTVHVPSPPSAGSRSFSSSAESETWIQVNDDDIDPSDSASRPRHSSRRPSSSRVSSSKHSTSRRDSHVAPGRPEPSRRRSSRRVPVVEEERVPSTRPHRAHSHRTHPERPDYHEHSESREYRHRDRVPSAESSSVEYHDDYAGYARPHVHHQHSGSQYGHPGYTASLTGRPSYSPFAGPNDALVHVNHHDLFAYGTPNPFSPPPSAGFAPNPLSPLSTSSGAAGYFGHDHHPPPHAPHPHHRPMAPQRPVSFVGPSSYGSDVMSPYYASPYAVPHGVAPGLPTHLAYMYYAQHSHSASPDLGARPPLSPPVYSDRTDSEYAKMAALLEKFELDRVTRETATLMKQEANRAMAEEERMRAEQLFEAAKMARDAAEKDASEKAKKAKEESDKALAEATKKAETLEKSKKALEDQVKKHKPDSDDGKAPIKFKDAVGRKFSFPWRICKNWEGMEALIRQAFLHVDMIGQHVLDGHYDLMGPDGDIILPQVWDSTIKPDWEVSMHMWPMPPEPVAVHIDSLAGFDGMMIGDSRGGGRHNSSGAKKSTKKGVSSQKDDKKRSSHFIGSTPLPPAPTMRAMEPVIMVPPPLSFPPGMMPPPPPPPHHLGPMMVDPMAGMQGLPPGIAVIDVGGGAGSGEKVRKTTSSSLSSKPRKKELPPLAAWMAGRTRGQALRGSSRG